MTQRSPWLYRAAMLGVALLLAFIPLAAQPAAADVSDFTFSEFSADYELSRDSQRRAQLKTTETFVAQFPDYPQNRGIIRYLPLDYNGVDLDTRLVSVYDEGGRAIYSETTKEDGLLAVSIGTDDYLTGEHTFVITYTQSNVVRDFANTNANEWYWDTNGTGWAQKFERVSARLRVSEDLVPSLTGNAACYQGVHGSTNKCAIRQQADHPQVFNAEATGGLEPRENMTLAVGFERGTFDIPTAPRNEWWNSVLPFVLLAFGAASLVMLGISRARLWRAPRGRGIIIPQYDVPKGINLLEAKELIDVSSGSLSAQLVSFAVRRNIRIVDQGSVAGSASSDVALVFRTAEGLDDLESRLMHALFGADPEPGQLVKLDGPNATRASEVHWIMTQVKQRVLARGWWGRPEQSLPWQWHLGTWGFAIAVFVSTYAVYSAEAESETTVLAVIGGVALCGIAAAVSWRPSWLTSAGLEMREYLQGMRMYLELAEKDRFAMLQSVPGAERVTVQMPAPAAVPADAAARGGDPEQTAAASAAPATGVDTNAIVHLYEQLLPFAVLWGIEQSWSQALAVHYAAAQEPAEWLQSPAEGPQFNLFPSLHSFTNSLSLAVSKPEPSPSSSFGSSGGTPSSWSSGGGSFSGGSTGGGFSGGGGGGGGGGGR